MADSLRIRCARPGFRRAGVAHAAGPVDWPAGAFTAEQLAALQAEPMLDVEVLPAPADGQGGDGSQPAPAEPPAAAAGGKSGKAGKPAKGREKPEEKTPDAKG